MSVTWTENQQKAIDIRSSNVLVSAAAGSGKTAVLVERVIKMLTDRENPVSIDRMLIATFTNAAAAEMRERIQRAITNQLEDDPQNEILRKQLALLGQAQITTVHSFCQNLIRNNFHILGISANFEIAEEVKTSKLKKEAMDDCLEERYGKMSESFLTLIDNFGGKRDDSKLIEIVMKIYNFSQSTPEPEKWLEESMRTGDFWENKLLEITKLQLYNIVALYDKAIEYIEVDSGLESYFDIFSKEREMIFGLIEICDKTWDDMYIAISNVVFDRLPRKSKEADEYTAKFVQQQRKSAKDNIGAISEFFSAPYDVVIEENKGLDIIIAEICELVMAFSKLFSEKKLENNLLDFNDLEHFAIKLLTDESFANDIREKYDEILVDEYQDTNGVQDKIFETVSNGNNLFVVGDVKQSIYGFRNAQPQNFIRKYDAYSTSGNQLGTKIMLSHNFRSTSGIIDFVNFVFEQIMSKEVGDVVYSNEERLICGNISAQNGEKPVEVHIIENKIEDDNNLSDEEKQYDQITREAIFTAQRIVKLVEVEKSLIFDKKIGANRPVQYRDIAVLSRSISNMSAIFAEQFALCGIPVYAEQTGSYFVTLEVATIISFLEIIDNPMQDIPLITVLRSPMFAFDDNELAEIRLINKTSTFYEILKLSKLQKAIDFIKSLNNYIEISKKETIEFLIRQIFSDTGYYSFVGTLPNGMERMVNLRLLCERASAFEADKRKTVFEFINYINLMIETNQQYTSAKLIGENDNVVTIMSTHKSKGLEFPVVFLVRVGKRFNTSDTKEPVLFDLNFGLAIDYIDINRNLKYPSVPKLAIEAIKKYELVSEEMRILYVALTRPKEKLIIIGTISKVSEKIELWQNTPLIPYSIANKNSFLDWIGLAVCDKGIIETHKAEEFLTNIVEMPDERNNKDLFDEDVYEQIDRRLSYIYPFSSAKNIPSKLSISEIVGGNQSEYKVKKIDFSEKAGIISAAERGTIIHFVLQNINLCMANNKNEITEQVAKMIQLKMLTKKQAEVIDIGAIADFFASDLGKRMRQSSDIKREYKFFVDIPANEILPDVDDRVKDEKILLQGVIDCCFLENDEFVIIDYKTGSFNEEYEKQLELYSLCLQKSTGKNVKETHIYPLI